jgi:nitroimidazol reductase NimA-like FMN-containing flavoprotein (pyridoxamine 5'-phosphate oxidase superfamily)
VGKTPQRKTIAAPVFYFLLTKTIVMLGELNETQINNILASQVVGRLACTDGKHPYIVPVMYRYDGKYIYGQTNEGDKLKILRENKNVCFETDTHTDLRNWQSVVAFGVFEELQDEEADKAREILFGNIFAQVTGSRTHKSNSEGAGIIADGSRIKDVMYRIRVKKLTGRFEKQ